MSVNSPPNVVKVGTTKNKEFRQVYFYLSQVNNVYNGIDATLEGLVHFSPEKQQETLQKTC